MKNLTANKTCDLIDILEDPGVIYFEVVTKSHPTFYKITKQNKKLQFLRMESGRKSFIGGTSPLQNMYGRGKDRALTTMATARYIIITREKFCAELI